MTGGSRVDKEIVRKQTWMQRRKEESQKSGKKRRRKERK